MYNISKLKRARKYWSDYYRNLPLLPNTSLWFKFQTVSASFRNFLPKIAYEEHAQLFKTLLINQKVAYMEQSSFDLINSMSAHFWDKGQLKAIKENPGIIATFHTGSFRLIGHYLAANGIPFKLVVANDGLLREENLANEVYGQTRRNSLGFDLIDANDKSCMLNICRTLRERKNVLIYVDGNTGGGDQYQNQNLITIPFLNQHINIRGGAAYAAFINNTPLYPVISARRWRYLPQLQFQRPIVPDKSLDKKVFVESAMTSLYKSLEEIVYEKPWLWDGWIYLHHFAKIVNEESILPQASYNDQSTKKFVTFNKRDYGFFRVDGKCFLFRKADYGCFEVERWLYIRLGQLYEGNYRFTVPMLNRNRMAELVRNRVVV